MGEGNVEQTVIDPEELTEILSVVDDVLEKAKGNAVNTGNPLFNTVTGKNNAVNDPADDRRIERWSRPNAGGGRDQYWQWASRKKHTGKQGGKKWRSYGGRIDETGRYLETTGRRGGRRERKGKQKEPSGDHKRNVDPH